MLRPSRSWPRLRFICRTWRQLPVLTRPLALDLDAERQELKDASTELKVTRVNPMDHVADKQEAKDSHRKDDQAHKDTVHNQAIRSTPTAVKCPLQAWHQFSTVADLAAPFQTLPPKQPKSSLRARFRAYVLLIQSLRVVTADQSSALKQA